MPVLSSSGATPHQARTPVPKAAMLQDSTNPRPAKAVGTPDNSKGADGDGRETVGIPLDGVEATSAIGSQKCEIPHRHQSPGTDVESNTSRVSRTSRPRSRRAARTPGNTGDLGNAPPREGGSAARHTTNPPIITSPDVKLRKRTFRIGTWNTRGKSGPTGDSKFNTAKMIMKLEKVDILVLTETHTDEASPPDVRGLKVLGHTGISNHKAGVAICALDNRGWSSLSTEVLIPGYAILCNLYHSMSTESIRVLGVYGDISDYASRVPFYKRLYECISDHILCVRMAGMDLHPGARNHANTWDGCIAAGDWNFVERDEDRFPYKPPSGVTRECRRIFRDIKTLCKMVDVGQHYSAYKHHTFAQNARGVNVQSRLDRIYRPRDGWKSLKPVPIKTNHSDHHFVWADCFITSPKVEIAVPAPRLLHVDKLSDEFWSRITKDWNEMTSQEIDLPAWAAFKQNVLRHGLTDTQKRKASAVNRWKDVLRGEAISRNMLDELCFDWRSRPSNDSHLPHRESYGVPLVGISRKIGSRPNTRKVVLYPDVSESPPSYTDPAPAEPS